ncbi:MAG: DUF3540 domain-containing protein [Comamonadaceae bacterium]|nr:MAG: DUF3540 domain-containing protein [Comamonadaceae bacterium]
MSHRDDPLIQLCSAPMQGVARVLEASPDGADFRIETPQGALRARLAASCLLLPQVGDRVWFMGDLAQGLFLSVVLERHGQEPACTRLPAGGRLEAADGRLQLRAHSMALDADTLVLRAGDVAASVGTVNVTGREATWAFGRVKLIADLFESFCDRVQQFARWSQRSVDGMDQVHSRHIDYRAEQTLQLHGQNVVTNATHLMKVDGEQIHMG